MLIIMDTTQLFVYRPVLFLISWTKGTLPRILWTLKNDVAEVSKIMFLLHWGPELSAMGADLGFLLGAVDPIKFLNSLVKYC